MEKNDPNDIRNYNYIHKKIQGFWIIIFTDASYLFSICERNENLYWYNCVVFFLVCYSNACQAHQIVWVVMIHKLIYIIFKFSLQKWFSYGALGLHRVTNDWYISMKNKQITFRIIEKRFMKSEKFKNPVEIIGNHVSMVY